MINWDAGQKVMITGGNSMIGSAVAWALCKRTARKEKETVIDTVPHKECDLLNTAEVYARFASFRPDFVIHAAGYNGGIEWNKKYPATIFERTVQMGLNVFNAAHRFGVRNILSIISSCAYPDGEVLKEEDFWNGAPHLTVDCHGFAKRVLVEYGYQMWKQYGQSHHAVVLNTCYGRGDSYHPEKTKVVGGMIKRFIEAKKQNLPQVQCWGTGSPRREFLFAPDAGELVVNALEQYYETYLPLNISSGQELTIKELAETVAKVVGYEGEILWDTTKPDGQMRKRLDTTRMRELWPDFQFTSLEDGLREAVDGYNFQFSQS